MHRLIPSILFALAAAAPAAGAVQQATPTAFSLAFSRSVKASPAAVYAVLVTPARWWSPDHTYSHDARNLTLDAQAGGCFCERWAAGSVEHGRVLSARPGTSLRLAAVLGPLQQYPLAGVLGFGLQAADGGGTVITASYLVSGPAAGGLEVMAPLVDQMIGAQLDRLAAAVDAPKP